MLQIPLLLAVLSLSPSLSSAYTWSFTSNPQQCKNLSLSVQGGGQPPYSLLLIPDGPSPFPKNVEVRRVTTLPFDGDSTSFSFQFKYPENSSFVAVVSDKSGFGSGGTSLPLQVGSSDDSSCYDVNNPVHAPWTYSTDPSAGITQCQPVRLYWQQPQVQGTVSFLGVIPGGNSFNVPTGTLSTNQQTGTGFDWTVNIKGGTNVYLLAGDNTGVGIGGSARYTVTQADDNSCLQANSPSSTAGSAAGGLPTGGSGSGGGSSGGSNTGAIVGGVVGGLGGALVLLLLGFFFLRRRRSHKSTKERPVDLFDNDDDPTDRHGELPQYYEPEPFLVPDPTLAATSDTGSTHRDDGMGGSSRPLSLATTTDFLRPNTPDHRSMAGMSTNTRKTAAPPQMRPVNFIQHDDAGPQEETPAETEAEQEPETIELPPAYTHIRK